MRNHRGFTLIEVLVAVALMSIGILAAQRAASQALKTYQFVKEHQIAMWVAENQSNLLLLTHEWLPLGHSSFDCSDMGHAFTCLRTVSPTSEPIFRRVDLSIVDKSTGNVWASNFFIIDRFRVIL